MSDSTTVQLSVGEVRSGKFSPSIVTFRNARASEQRAATSPSPLTTSPAWMVESLNDTATIVEVPR